jgi:putative transposase
MSVVSKVEKPQPTRHAGVVVTVRFAAMPRKPRYELPPGFVHVTQRGNRRADVFTAERDVSWFEEFLDDGLRRSGAVCHATCLMRNHFHFVVEVEVVEQLSTLMQRVNGLYAQWFNRYYGFDGHVFQGPYKARAVTTDAHFADAVRYVVLNPVRAGLTATPAAWPWSSYLATIGAAAKRRYLTIDRVLAYFANNDELAQERFKNFVADGIALPSAMFRADKPRDLARERSRELAPPAMAGGAWVPSET